METFIADRVGRTFIVKLVQGDMLLESIERLIREEAIENAVVVSGIATFDRARLHMITTTGYPSAVHIEEKTDVPLEVTSVDGFICDGEPHIHCTIADKNAAYAGHVLKGCRILYLGELVIQELLGASIRRHENEKGSRHIYARD